MLNVKEILPYIIPIMLVQVVAQILSIIQLLKPETKVRGGNKLIWGIVIVAFQLFGVLAYHLIGRIQSEE